ncbi:hypothetical protein BU25DRAFT_179314 [Macroventuria anomochaeta]|uniref:Uncharacterized protein n=1 Tax=Macroventuria anomochaeta TaxID=301207 RepID=A0ACB6RQP8_9PLEO|nr:uncharacterized protein BU25DRAFT_179314 [Macroventuria anomochaeta]KAF2623453.1 hypothetical protein BU25DRAFT_179314 [Macroventuria anomochaeta]
MYLYEVWPCYWPSTQGPPPPQKKVTTTSRVRFTTHDKAAFPPVDTPPVDTPPVDTPPVDTPPLILLQLILLQLILLQLIFLQSSPCSPRDPLSHPPVLLLIDGLCSSDHDQKPGDTQDDLKSRKKSKRVLNVGSHVDSRAET